MAEVRMCDKDPTQQAVYSYRFDWGEEGVCCSEQATRLQQVAAQTGRGVVLVPLSTEPPALTLDERRQHHATRLALEEELSAAKARGLELYRVNQQLASELRAANAVNSELQVQLAECKTAVDRQADLTRRAAGENADLVAEVERLRAVASLVMHPPEPSGPLEEPPQEA